MESDELELVVDVLLVDEVVVVELVVDPVRPPLVDPLPPDVESPLLVDVVLDA